MKYLRIDCLNSKCEIKLEDLNRFKQLEKLEIENLKIDKDIKLSFNNLKTLSIDLEERNLNSFEIETPNLQALNLHFYPNELFKSIKFHYTASIQYHNGIIIIVF